MRKKVFNSSFDYPEAELLVQIVDNPDVARRKIASACRDKWGTIEPIKNHTLVHIIALGCFEKTGTNQNGDAFEEFICRNSHDSFTKRARLYRHHKSKIPDEQSDGFVPFSAYNDPMGRAELIIAANNDKCADWLDKVDRGGEVKFSMGWHCDGDYCSICDNFATKRAEYCQHVKKGASYPFGMNRILEDGRKCHVFNRDGYWNDISYVGRGADMIAMDLAKVAGIDDDEVISGAELAEIMEGGVLSSQKYAMAQKMSNIQKHVSAIGITPRAIDEADFSESTLRELQDKNPGEMFGALAKIGCILPFKAFYKLAAGSRYPDFKTIVENAVPHISQYIEKELKLAGSMSRLSSIHSYDPASGNTGLSQRAVDELLGKFAADPSLQEDKILSNSLSSIKVASDSTTTVEGQALVRQYLAYKVAALSEMDANNEVLFNAALLN